MIICDDSFSKLFFKIFLFCFTFTPNSLFSMKTFQYLFIKNLLIFNPLAITQMKFGNHPRSLVNVDNSRWEKPKYEGSKSCGKFSKRSWKISSFWISRGESMNNIHSRASSGRSSRGFEQPWSVVTNI